MTLGIFNPDGCSEYFAHRKETINEFLWILNWCIFCEKEIVNNSCSSDEVFTFESMEIKETANITEYIYIYIYIRGS